VEGRQQWEEKMTSWTAQQEQQEEEEGNQTLIREAKRLHRFLKDFFPALDRFPRTSSWQGMVEASLLLLGSYFQANDENEAVATYSGL